MCHRCHMLVLGVLLHLQIFTTLFEFCHKLVRRARYQKTTTTTTTTTTKERKKEAKALLYFTQESKPLHHGQSSRQMLLFLIDNVAFAKENTNKTYEAVKNWSLAAPNMASLATDAENQTNNYDQDQESSFCKAKKQKQQTNKRTLHSKHFLQHQHTRGLQWRHTSTTTKTCVACGNSPDMRVNTRYINSTRGTASKRSTARLDLSAVDGKVKENGELEEKRNSPARST